MQTTAGDLATLTVPELSDLILRSFDAIAARPGPEAVAALTGSAASLGLAIGTASTGWASATPANAAIAAASAEPPKSRPARAPRGASGPAKMPRVRTRRVPAPVSSSLPVPSLLVPAAAAAPTLRIEAPEPRPSLLIPAPEQHSSLLIPAPEQHSSLLPMTMYGIREPQPGPRWKALFEATWDGYRRWYLSEGTAARPDLDTARAMLRRHLPELIPTWERLVDLTGGDELAARMLTLWNPPKFLPGCSQAVLEGPAPVLIRNYDYGMDLFERVVYSSEFTGRKVLGTGDCLWGLLDGMNDAGLAVSLAFGGRRGSGPGFAIPLVVRYLLEVADSLADVRRILERLPVSMAYNLTVVDSTGKALTAYVAPGVSPEFTDAPVATNHRGVTPDDPAHAERFRSVERQRHLVDALEARPDREDLAAAFLRPPLYTSAYSRDFGTLYTAVYRPAAGIVDYRWPDDSWQRTFDSPDATKTVVLREPR